MSESLCFLEAMLAKSSKSITEREYFGHLLAHFRGVRHPRDSGREPAVSKLDPVGGSIREMALRDDYEPLGVEQTSLYEDILHCCSIGSFEEMKATFEKIEQQSLRIPIQPLATMAALASNAEILQFCLDRGAIFDQYLNLTAKQGAITPAMLDVLFRANWRNIQSSQEVMNQLIERAVRQDIHMLNWLLAHGACIRPEDVRKAVTGTAAVHVPTLAILVDEMGGIDHLKKSGVIQMAAQDGHNKLISYLLDAGIDVDEAIPPYKMDLRQAGPTTALYAAVKAKNVETVRLLLQRGAKVDLANENGPHGNETPLQAAEKIGDTEILELLRSNEHVAGGL